MAAVKAMVVGAERRVALAAALAEDLAPVAAAKATAVAVTGSEAAAETLSDSRGARVAGAWAVQMGESAEGVK